MNLGEFHAEVKSHIARGSAQDAIIPGFVRRAALWMERNYTFQYMKQFLEVEIDLEVASSPRYIELPWVPKSIPMFRWVLEDGTFQYLKRIEAEQINTNTSGTATGYWLDGVKRIVLSATPDENLNGEARIDFYSPWPSELTFNHWLIDRAEDVLLGQTLVFIATRLREPKMVQEYRTMRDEGLNTLLRAEDELIYTDQDAAMEYRPEGE